MKFKLGDKVIIRKSVSIVGDMFVGKIATIVEVHEASVFKKRYSIDIDNKTYYWFDEELISLNRKLKLNRILDK